MCWIKLDIPIQLLSVSLIKNKQKIKNENWIFYALYKTIHSIDQNSRVPEQIIFSTGKLILNDNL